MATLHSFPSDDFPREWVQEPTINKLSPEAIQMLPPKQREEVRQIIAEWEYTVLTNPLYGVFARNINQHKFMASDAYIAALFGGNRSGKTAGQVIKAIVNCVPLDAVPPHLRQYRVRQTNDPFYARICVPSLQEHAHGVTVPLLRRWVPTYTLKNKNWEDAWSNKFSILRFANGSFIEFRSYDQDIAAHQGSSRHMIFFDEQPPKDIFEESLLRLAEYEGARSSFALTPLGLSWVYHEIYKRRNDPTSNIEVFHSSIHENDTLSASNVALALAGVTNAAQREAREFGRFVSMAGRVYDNFSSAEAPAGHVLPAIRPEQLRGDIYIGIDPGIRQPAAVFCMANNLKEQLLVFDEVVPYFESTMNIEKFCKQILERVRGWGIKNPTYIIDPAALIPDQNTGEALTNEYLRQGIGAYPGNNRLELGIGRVAGLIDNHQLAVTKNCTTVQDEFEVWSWDQRLEEQSGKPRPMEGNDHTLDCIRYVTMMLPWAGAPIIEDTSPAPGTLEAEINKHRQPPPDEEVSGWY